MMARSIATAVAIALAALTAAIATSSSFAAAAPRPRSSPPSRKLLETSYWRRSNPGFYPGDNVQGWNELGWGPDGRYYYSLNGYRGYFSAGCFGCGRWSGGGGPQSPGPAAAAASSSSGGGGASAAASSGPAPSSSS